MINVDVWHYKNKEGDIDLWKEVKMPAIPSVGDQLFLGDIYHEIEDVWWNFERDDTFSYVTVIVKTLKE